MSLRSTVAPMFPSFGLDAGNAPRHGDSLGDALHFDLDIDTEPLSDLQLDIGSLERLESGKRRHRVAPDRKRRDRVDPSPELTVENN
jgi:hypothetical protein